MKTAIYLRKSRADLEAEARGEGETLAKHRTTLLKIAKEMNLNVLSVREEIVSGESLVKRPEMLALLEEIEDNKYDVVLCMDMDRLGRGGMKEQGIILETFKRSNTKIMTPRKTYDLNDEWDEEYSEFEAFMARKELKIITRRMQRGRVASVEAGNYLGTHAPFGYDIHRLNKRERTLTINSEEASVVRMIFDWYANEDMGANAIRSKLNDLGYKSKLGNEWNPYSILDILKNNVYIGKVTWQKRKEVKRPDAVKRSCARQDKSEWIIADGKHEPIIPESLFEQVQEKLNSRYHIPYNTNGIKNPLAGIIKCSKCGYSMVQRYPKNRKETMDCKHRGCENKSSYTELIEKRLIEALKEWYINYKADFEKHKQDDKLKETQVIQMNEAALRKLDKELVDVQKQKNNLHDLLERGVYTVDMFLERSNVVSDRITEITSTMENLKKEIKTEIKKEKVKKDTIPQVEHVLDLYFKTDDPKKKNSLLKSVLEKAVYKKEKWQRLDDFELVLYPKLPQDGDI
ncbi:recombinase family protein [Bacillus toyonensis]|uniref:recombinase family protein n=1 Tax=Bacillus toyonensis TaxID=155322 RepID=UPI000BEFA353|nr:recombinase family protein [Bacillus toyonensis]PEN31277.1 recombinase family protein [Bacillus toyonensis]QWH90256.1 recombinase family protein [Bacillus toyonensis]QWI33408.1 recombinase family protein [Bacillus toyonensis]